MNGNTAAMNGNTAVLNVILSCPLVLSFLCRACEGAGVAQERDEDQRRAVGPGQEHHPQRGLACPNQGRPGFLRDHAAGALFYFAGIIYVCVVLGFCLVCRRLLLLHQVLPSGGRAYVPTCTGGYYFVRLVQGGGFPILWWRDYD